MLGLTPLSTECVPELKIHLDGFRAAQTNRGQTRGASGSVKTKGP